jgi:aldehyde dehydrogenase (NAD+)
MESAKQHRSNPATKQEASAALSLPHRQIHRDLRSAFDAGKTRSYKWRQRQLTAVLKFLYKERSAVRSALHADLGKSRVDADAEAMTVVLEVITAKRHLKGWMRDRKVGTPLMLAPARSYVRREPLGVVLIFGAWNYPLHLSLMPLVGALAAGNAVLLKPSELAPATSELLATRLTNYLDPEAVRMVEGGADVAEELLRLRFDHIFYTGNGAVGSRVMKAAADHLTPVTLELGGKSPVIVDKTADIAITARRLAFAKWTNAGQTCVAPDYALVEKSVESDLVRALQQNITDFYGPDPKASRAYGRIVNERHVTRLQALMQSGKIVTGGEVDLADRYVAPTIMTQVSAEDPVMREEIFGPIFPILSVSSMDEAISFINERPKPLALYLFTKDRSRERAILDGTSSGGVCVNHAGLHLVNPKLPFGGVGESGTGAYHGEASFDTFSHRRSVLRKPFFFDPTFIYPKFKKSSERKKQR